jgi:hypothetical protein
MPLHECSHHLMSFFYIVSSHFKREFSKQVMTPLPNPNNLGLVKGPFLMWPTQALPITHPRPIKTKGVIDKIITKGVICPFQSNSITQLCVSVFLWEFLFVAKSGYHPLGRCRKGGNHP